MSDRTKNYERLQGLLARVERGGFRQLPAHGLDLTLAQVGLLATVARGPGQRIQELAEAMGLTAPTVSVAVRKLEESGWLRREADENDKRASCIFLTGRAEKIVRKIMKRRQEKMAKVFERFTDEEQEQLLHLLEKAITSLEE